LPRELKKYTGSVARYQKSNVTFETTAEAEQYVHETNVREDLPIRNRFTIFVDQVLVELPGNKLQICNYTPLVFTLVANILSKLAFMFFLAQPIWSPAQNSAGVLLIVVWYVLL